LLEILHFTTIMKNKCNCAHIATCAQ
jgi:hypothetical protein